VSGNAWQTFHQHRYNSLSYLSFSFPSHLFASAAAPAPAVAASFCFRIERVSHGPIQAQLVRFSFYVSSSEYSPLI